MPSLWKRICIQQKWKTHIVTTTHRQKTCTPPNLILLTRSRVLHCRNALPRALQILLPERYIIVSRRHSQDVSRDGPRNAPYRCRKSFHFGSGPRTVGLRLRPDDHSPVFAAAGHHVARHTRSRTPRYVPHPVGVLAGGVLRTALLFPSTSFHWASVAG